MNQYRLSSAPDSVSSRDCVGLDFSAIAPALGNQSHTKGSKFTVTKYLAKSSYSLEGIQSLLKDGGIEKREAVQQLAASLGGTVEAYYYAFGETDAYVILDFPDNVSAATASLVVSAAGRARVKMTVLLTPEEVDEVAKKSAVYAAPGKG
jgi:uncharacterized protein with GYD domain